MKSLSLTFFFFLSIVAFGQQSVKVLDAETGEPVPGVLIEILDKDATQIDGSITNIDGLVNFDLAGNYKVKVSHVSYEGVTKKLVSGQQVIKIFPATTTLGDVVVTGQYHPQSAEKSVYNVKSIRAEVIQDQGSVQLQEVLSKQVNIRIAPDMALGSSSMSLQGIPGKNVKVLIDGIPLVNRNGNGNDVDLSQINLSNIERIEIVEGPMSVNYGANALAGVVNLITKKPKRNAYRFGLDFQGEAIDQKYGLDNGKTNINLTSSVSLTNNFMVSLNGGVTRFGGYQGIETGREYEWDPKDQFFYDASLWYKAKNHNVSYKFDHLNEIIYNRGFIQEDFHAPTGTTREYAKDSEYTSRRFGNQVQLDGKITNNLRYNLVGSYSDFVRYVEEYRLWLDTNEKVPNSNDTTSFTAFITRGSIQSANPTNSFKYQIGFDINYEATEGGRIKDENRRTMQDYAGFASFEYSFNNKLTIRPGLRGSYNSSFSSWVSPSLNFKYLINNNLSLSGAYGNGYRAPSLRELYFEFIDSNHTVIGNENLTPEYSHHYDLNLEHHYSFGKGSLTSKASTFYNDIKDLITYLFDPNDGTYAKYTNLNRLYTMGINLSESLTLNEFNMDLGIGVVGKKEIDPQVSLPEEYFFSPEVSINANYREKNTKIKFNVFYKYNGPSTQYLFDANDELSIGTLEGYNLLDVTINRQMFNYLTLTLGVKNLLNVKSLTNSASSAISGGIHTSSTQRTIGYGRSGFFKIAINIDSNNKQ